MRKIIELMAISLFFLALSSASYAEIFRENGNIGVVVHEINWKVISETANDLTKYINFSFEKLSDTEYIVYWEWTDLDIMKKINECADYQLTRTGDIGKCLTEVNDAALTSDKDFTANLEKISIVPIETSTFDIKLVENSIDLTKSSGIFRINLLSREVIGEIIKIGFKSTIIELTDVNAEIIIDPEIESCRDGLCIHNIQINNNTDSNFCFNSLDIYGSFDPKVKNQKMYFYKKYSDENGEWYAWDELTTQVCVTPHTTGQLKYYYNVPHFSAGKWNFHFWYNGIDYEIDPYYNSKGWTFTTSSDYDFNASAISVDGNASLIAANGLAYAQWHLNESIGAAASDSSGNNRNGTLVNMEDADWIAGKLNNALQFDGVNEYINCGDIANFERTESFSVDFWIKTSSTNTSQIVGRRSSIAPATQGWDVLIVAGVTAITLSNNATSNALSVRSTTTINSNTWRHIAITYNGTSLASGVSIYIDGVKETSYNIIVNTLTASITNSANCAIGSRNALDWFYAGSVDELAIYTKVLSQSDDTIYIAPIVLKYR